MSASARRTAPTPESRRDRCGVDLVVAARENHDRVAVGGEHQRLDDRADRHAERRGRLVRGAGRVRQLADLTSGVAAAQGSGDALDVGVHASGR